MLINILENFISSFEWESSVAQGVIQEAFR